MADGNGNGRKVQNWLMGLFAVLLVGLLGLLVQEGMEIQRDLASFQQDYAAHIATAREQVKRLEYVEAEQQRRSGRIAGLENRMDLIFESRVSRPMFESWVLRFQRNEPALKIPEVP